MKINAAAANDGGDLALEECVVHDCKFSTEIALMQEKIKTLENGQDREEAFRKMYYSDREAMSERNARLDLKIDSIEKNVSELVNRQKEEDSKPRKRIDGIIDKLIWAVIGAVVMFVLAKLGLSGS